jgi:hypothetical protein
MALKRISGNDLDLAVVPVDGASLHNDWKFTVWLALGLVGFLAAMECVSVVGLWRVRTEAALKRDLKLFGEY